MKTDKTSQKSFFDEKASVWDVINKPEPLKIEYLLGKLSFGDSDSILDVGTGTGILIPFLREKSPNGSILAVDFSEGMIEQAKKKYGDLPKVRFEVMDVESDPIDATFDKIILFSMFPHLEHKVDTISRLVAQLNPDGRLMIAHDQGREFLNNLHRNIDEKVENSRLIPVEDQKKQFERAGIVVENCFESDSYYYMILKKKEDDRVS